MSCAPSLYAAPQCPPWLPESVAELDEGSQLLGLASDLSCLASAFHPQGIFLYHHPRQHSQYMIPDAQRNPWLLVSGFFTKGLGPSAVLCLLVCVRVCGRDGGNRRQGGWRRRQRGGDVTHSKGSNKLLLGSPSCQYFLLPFLPSLVLTTRPFGIRWLEDRHALNRSGPSSPYSASLKVDIGIAFITLCFTFETSRKRNFTVRPQWRESVPLTVRKRLKQHTVGPVKCVLLVKCQTQPVIWF